MPHWEHTLNVKDIWESFESYGFEASRDAIVSRIRKASFYDEDDFGLMNRIDDLEMSDDLDDFNWAWNEFYDWADASRVWVKTF